MCRQISIADASTVHPPSFHSNVSLICFSLSQCDILHFGIDPARTHAHAHVNTSKPLKICGNICSINTKDAGRIDVLTTFFESKRLGCLDIIPGYNEQLPFLMPNSCLHQSLRIECYRMWVDWYFCGGLSDVRLRVVSDFRLTSRRMYSVWAKLTSKRHQILHTIFALLDLLPLMVYGVRWLMVICTLHKPISTMAFPFTKHGIHAHTRAHRCWRLSLHRKSFRVVRVRSHCPLAGTVHTDHSWHTSFTAYPNIIGTLPIFRLLRH